MTHVAMIPCGDNHSIFVKQPFVKEGRIFSKVKTTMEEGIFQPVELIPSADGSELEIKNSKGDTIFSFQKEWIELIEDNE